MSLTNIMLSSYINDTLNLQLHISRLELQGLTRIQMDESSLDLGLEIIDLRLDLTAIHFRLDLTVYSRVYIGEN